MLVGFFYQGNGEIKINEKSHHTDASAEAGGGQTAEEEGWTHLCHFKDALWIQAASAHLPRAGDRALVCDRDDQARHRAGLLLQSRVHHVPVAHLQENGRCQGSRAAHMLHCLCDNGL